MPREQKAGRRKGNKAGGNEICPGYMDENGIWNTGFYCPRWGGPDQQYCCGDAVRRYCCPKPKTTEPPEVVSYIPIVIGISVTLVVLAAVLFVTCCFCPCCPGYKKRQKRLQKAQQELQLQQQQQQSHDLPDVAVQASGHGGVDRDPSPGPGGPGQYSPPSRPSCSVAHATHAEVLHCGCQWSPALSRSPMSDLDSIMKQLYGDSNASWNELEPLKEYPADKPPPYTEHDMHRLGLKAAGAQQHQELLQGSHAGHGGHTDSETETKTLGRRFKERKEQAAAEHKVTRAISDPSQLCMKSFRPVMMRPGHRLDSDTKRDSGVLVEEGESMLESEQPPFVLQGVPALRRHPVMPRPGMVRYNSRGSLEVDPMDVKASVHASHQEYEHQDMCS